MRFVAVKSAEQQAFGLVFRTRDLLVRQRTQLINAVRGHLTEYGWVAPKGPSHFAMLSGSLNREMTAALPAAAVALFRVMLNLLADLSARIVDLNRVIARRARKDEAARRLMTAPGIGPITATALIALAPAAETFSKGRNFAVWLRIAPLQRSTAANRSSSDLEMNKRTLRRLLIIGGSTVVKQACRRGAPK